MCASCGCENHEFRLDGQTLVHGGALHLHDHDHAHPHPHPHPEHTHAPGLSIGRMVRIERDILADNEVQADANRRWLKQRGIFAVNLVSGPGAGKTTLLTRTIERLRGSHEVSVIEGDQQTSQDADRIRAAGARAVQINTGKGCHLDAHMVQRALGRLDPAPGSVLMIENVGNLVCPAAFELGEADKVVVLSVAEGEDKPLKYPDIFRAASVMLLSKVDLLPYVSFEVGRCVDYALRVNPGIRVIEICATRGDGMVEWLRWIEDGARLARRERLPGPEQDMSASQVWGLVRGA